MSDQLTTVINGITYIKDERTGTWNSTERLEIQAVLIELQKTKAELTADKNPDNRRVINRRLREVSEQIEAASQALSRAPISFISSSWLVARLKNDLAGTIAGLKTDYEKLRVSIFTARSLAYEISWKYDDIVKYETKIKLLSELQGYLADCVLLPQILEIYQNWIKRLNETTLQSCRASHSTSPADNVYEMFQNSARADLLRGWDSFDVFHMTLHYVERNEVLYD